MTDYEHQPWCQLKGWVHTDAAKRMTDEYNLHRVAAGYDAIGKWIACALQDGTSDHVLYDDKLSAVTHQRHNESRYVFIKINPSSSNPCEMEVMLRTSRRLYDAGMRMTDPDHKHGGPSVIRRLMVEDELNFMRGAVTNLVMPWDRKASE